MRGAMALAVAATLITGCDFYFGDDGDCEFAGPSTGGFGAPEEPEVVFEVRDPLTGQCQALGGSGTTGDPCEPRPLPQEDRAPQADPDFGACISECTGLDEATCLDTPLCRAVYQLGEDLDPAAAPYAECWAIAPSGPAQAEVCDGLDAYQCSRHDDCVAYHVTEFGCDAPDGADCAPMARLGGFASCGPGPETL